jgi:hypothetical protein
MLIEVSDHRVFLGPNGSSLLSAAQAPAGIEYALVHRQNPDYKFLHEPRLEVFENTLFVNFSNAPQFESEPAQIMRGRRSLDGGHTWGDVEIVAGGFTDGRRRHETAPLLARQDGLWAFVGRYDYGSKHSLGMEVYRLAADRSRFEPVSDGLVARGFVPFVRPQRLGNGNWIIGGHIRHATQAAVAISEGDDLLRWQVVPIGHNVHPGIPETALIVDGSRVVALIRPDRAERMTASVAVSYCDGEDFGPTEASDLPVVDSKLFSGTLSTGNHYVIFNATEQDGLPGELPRHRLLIGIMHHGGLGPLMSVYSVIEDTPSSIAAQIAELGEGNGMHAWAYPEAVEHEGTLHVVFSMNKRHCWLARIPVASLVR